MFAWFKFKLTAVLVSSLILLSVPFERVHAGAMVAGFNSNTLARNDDGSTGLVNIGFSTNFFGTTYTQLYVNNNGNVTFSGALSDYVPFNLYTTGTSIIAPFFADVDTRPAASAATQYGTGTYQTHAAFGVTWNGVGYYNQQTNVLNNFQLVLVDRSDTGTGNFDIVFNYDHIGWDHGSASSVSARAGYSNGVAATSYELTGSAVSGAFLDNGSESLIHDSLNSGGVDGRYVFFVRNGAVSLVDTSAPEPGTLTLLIAGGFGVAGYALRRRKALPAGVK